MLSALKKYLMIPKLVRLSAGAPRDQRVAWDKFWSTVKATGAEGDVLWDSGSDREMKGYVHRLRQHLDAGLPVVDIGCGNGSFTRQLAGHFPHAVGVDVSLHAVQRARTESAGLANVSYTVRDMTAQGAGAGLMDELPVLGAGGGANVFIRGVLHVLGERDRRALAENVRAITGANGRVFLAETDFQGNALDYVAHLGATFRSIPAPLENAIQGLPMPGRFGPKERTLAFPATRWELIEDGPTTLETVPLSHPTRADLIPGYFAVLKARDQAG
ncbi:class I SAM-dependent methyltransferase [Arthrobacter sp. ISL-72]|uniref:class I SAM-dependent methyltransferase n=1 Tax=Arthrobacter sp. ISL-72 TaxID=2819114 RepID=UPI001BEC8286|nr:class I SAM-dependent methyltransferase [Arthrobacter sp. ISL-72]MBT2597025.1 class I SAM-dependent methyltransferase [Arthrobacter sp. ISL-72]